MAKVSKSILKSLIKECIIEVLQEGLGFEDVLSERARPQPRRRAVSQAAGLGHHEPRIKSPRRTLAAPAMHKQAPPSLSSRVPNTIASVSNDPTIQALLEDTAQSTLPYQDRAESSRGPQAQSDIPLEALDLMGAQTSTWETLAFTNNNPTNSSGIKPE